MEVIQIAEDENNNKKNNQSDNGGNNDIVPANNNDKEQEVPVDIINDSYDYPLLEDICGSTEFKEEIKDIFNNIFYADMFEMFGVPPYKSFMFEGEAGTGKTFLAKGLRNELIKEGKEAIFMPYDIGTYGTAYLNMGAKNLQKFFDTGTKMKNTLEDGVIIYFMDEVDSIMAKRGGSHSHKEDDKVLNCLMKNLQEINSYKKNEYFIGATNFFESLDYASIRSGRIDKIVHFDKPGVDGLKEAYKGYIGKLKNKMQENSGHDLVKKINYNRLAEQSQGFNFADVEQVVYNTVRNYATDLIKQSQLVVPVLGRIGEKDFLYEIDKMREQRYKDKGKVGF